MRVALDAQLAIGTATGIGEYVRGLARALRNSGTDVVELSEPGLDPWRFDRRILWDQVLLPRRARASGADVLHCASGTVPYFSSLPLVATVHDVAWLRVQAHAPAYARYYFGAFSVERYRMVAQIAVDSEFSRGELLRVLAGYDADRVHVVYPGVADDFCALRRRAGDGRTILIVGTVERRKNLDALIRLLPELDGARIVSVGPPTPYQAECAAVANDAGLADRVEFRGYVEREELLELYATCGVVAVPSQYEGFGYAAAQALCSGTPCVVSDQGALPEIVAGDAPIVAMDDVSAWRAALGCALRGEDDVRAAAVRERAIARLAWAASARKMESVYADALTAHAP
ncbi:MAG: glycosyltransferase family 4 protein [Candidatus Eremiobacteraeota bacterium]|nr:glycosyltransferase family 4 protein [Candidatus Eremiobacteraeota bacterium]MBV8373212.1 glycosyltransferase family 4 protein [Candidatus Eremiobacteraeota bacterium]